MDAQLAKGVIEAEAPRRLRLDELLRELGAHHGSEPPGDRAGQYTVGDLVDKAAEAGFGFLIGVLALVAIPFVGLSTPFGLAIGLIGVQLMLGRRTPWLPQRARRRVLSIDTLDRVLAILAKRTHWLARSTRRRWGGMVMPRLVGLFLVFLAAALALPLPFPGSNLIFLIPLFIYSVGILERDGVWIAIGHVWTLVDVALLVVFGKAVVAVLDRMWGWLW